MLVKFSKSKFSNKILVLEKESSRFDRKEINKDFNLPSGSPNPLKLQSNVTVDPSATS